MEKLPVRMLIADDEKNIRELLRNELSTMVSSVQEVESGVRALEELEKSEYDILLLDLTMPEMDGITVLKKLKALDIPAEIIILTANATVQTAVEAMKLGACDYLMKPFRIAELLPVVEKAYEKKKLRSENLLLKTQVKKQSEIRSLIAESPMMREVIGRSKKIAHSDFPVLITGESGTGKELIARFIHNESPRADRSYVVINCGALPDNMIESELFGYEKGAFTGAQARKPGLLEIANEGTLFLDEIGDMPLPLQVKLLRVIETGTFYRLGGTREQQVNVRIISATNKNLKAGIEKGVFREDLYYRVSALAVHVPPLRERREDIVPLVEHCRRGNPAFKQKQFSSDALKILSDHAWPGNVRQLQNMVHHALLLSTNDLVEPPDLSCDLEGRPARTATRLDELEREHVLRMLRQAGGDRNKAAAALGIHTRTLARRLEEYGVE
ncbi:MAG: sigma-54 dependent transcriptional regulator [Nitrospirota bacterium]|nr:sigma-54 dependent transcriptional regulator [Nitrospirota bacterium]